MAVKEEVRFSDLAFQAMRLEYRNTPAKREGVGTFILDMLFWAWAIVTVIGSGFRFIMNHPETLYGLPFDSPIIRLIVMIAVGYASLAQSLLLIKTAFWYFGRSARD